MRQRLNSFKILRRKIVRLLQCVSNDSFNFKQSEGIKGIRIICLRHLFYLRKKVKITNKKTNFFALINKFRECINTR